MLSQSLYQSISSGPGVYLFLGKASEVLYVGKAKNLKKRVSSYFRRNLSEKTSILVSQIRKIKTIEVNSEIESLLLEANLIQKYFPRYNVRFADGKAYPLIRITIKDKYPKVLTARRMEDRSSAYFGPYPNVGALKTVLKITRRIFPYQSVVNHPKKFCFYHHIGLCPCPELINDRIYKKSIMHLIDFLKGNTRKVIRELEKERDIQSKNENYEEANGVQKKIESIKLVTSDYYSAISFEENPNLKEDIRRQELHDLSQILFQNGVKTKYINRIECFDISVISGKYAAGSMVVFTQGEKDSKWYRRFKVLKSGKPDDFAMMAEVLNRRFNHNEWPLPDLLIVDGGKGQVSTVSKILKKRNLTIPLIGLAKREETIITSNFNQIKLPKNSKVLHLVMRVRDEAHRFAVTYHRLLRSKYLNS